MCAKNMQGFSLIELFVTLLISSLLFVQAAKIYTWIADQLLLINEEIEYYESSEIVHSIFFHYVRLAGLKEENQLFKANNSFSDNQFITGKDNVKGIKAVKTGSDVLQLRFIAPSKFPMKDCKNTHLKKGEEYILDFYLDRESQLRCKGAASKSGRRSSAVLIDKVKDLQIEYGFLDGQKFILCSADCVTSLQAWPKLKLVRLKITKQESELKNPKPKSFVLTIKLS